MSVAVTSDQLTPSQLGWVLCDIATSAKVIDRLSVLLNACASDGDDEAFIVSIGHLAQRIGWAADMALGRSAENVGPCYGDAEQWMMPPAFHETPKSRSKN